MKTDDLIQLFAQDYLKADGKVGSSAHAGVPSASVKGLYFYSYLTPIARLFPKSKVVWLSSQKFSATTTRQQSGLRWVLEKFGWRVLLFERAPANEAHAEKLFAKQEAGKLKADHGQAEGFPKRTRRSNKNPMSNRAVYGQLVGPEPEPKLLEKEDAEW